MPSGYRFETLVGSMLAIALAVSGACRSRSETHAAGPFASAGVLAPEREVVFSARDGMPLHGHYVAAIDPAAPLAVLVHSFRGSSAEWRPLVERMAVAPRDCSVLSFDLRGHGASTVDAKGAHTDWTALSHTEIPGLVWDIHAAIDYGLAAAGGRTRGVILVGSSLSAALVAQVAREQPKVVALALISPGDMLEGYDVFHRYHAVAELPTFVATSLDDTISLEPARLIARLGAERVTLEQYPGSGHGPGGMTRTGDDRLWSDLVTWIERVRADAPHSRPTVARGSPPDFTLPAAVSSHAVDRR